MQIGVDETGDFNKSSDRRFSLVTLVTVTDKEWFSFHDFVENNFTNGFKNIKGNNISFTDRKKIIKYISHHPEIKYTCIVFDHNFGDTSIVESHKTQQILKIQNWVVNNLANVHPKMIDDLSLLRDQIGNLSPTDYAKYFFITELFIFWQRFFQMDYALTSSIRDSWIMNHVVDMQVKADKFKRIVNSTMHLTANSFNPNFRIITPVNWKKTHPFLLRHSFRGDLCSQDGKKFFEHFKIGDEKTDHILFLPDLIGNSIYNSILHLNEIKWLKLLSYLKSNRSISMIKGRRKDLYYVIRGFSGANLTTKPDPIFQTHWEKMLKY